MKGILAQSFLAVPFLFALCTAPAAAQKLDVKPGLWEITMAEPRTVTKVCYTAEVLSGGISQVPAPAGLECKNEVLEQTSRLVVTRTVCTGAMSMDGQTRMEIQTREAMTMESTAVMTMGGRKQTIKVSAAYKWLGADCGTVKPFDPKGQVK